MTTYAQELAGEHKAVCMIWDFPDLDTRFVTQLHDGLSLPSGYTQFVGAVPRSDAGSRLDVMSGKLTVGGTSFEIPDESQAVTAWLKDHDAELHLTRVVRKDGFIGVAEAGYQETRWVFEDTEVSGKQGGGYAIKLANALKAMNRGLYEDFDGESYRLDETAHPTGLGPSATTITLEKSPKSQWREPGNAILWNEDAKLIELVTYQTIGGTGNKDLQTVTRQKYAVGDSSFTFPQDNSQIWQVWVKRGNPVDLMLEWLTTTEAGGNGSYDQADGDGLGLDTWFLDLTAIEDVRDDYWTQPTFNGSDHLTAGTAVLFVEKKPIRDVKRWIEDHILRPFALFPATENDERFSIETYYRVPPNTIDIGNEWEVGQFNASQWRRNYRNRINNLRLLTDWNPAEGEHDVSVPKLQNASNDRFGKAKAEEIACRGGRTGRLGFPDYGSDDNVQTSASRLLLEAANPWTPLKIKAFYKHKDIGLTDAVTINIPNVPNLRTGQRGTDSGDLFLVIRRRVVLDADRIHGHVELEIRLRRPVLRPAIVASDTAADNYSAASPADKQNGCYVTPGDTAQFDNGDEGYTIP